MNSTQLAKPPKVKIDVIKFHLTFERLINNIYYLESLILNKSSSFFTFAYSPSPYPSFMIASKISIVEDQRIRFFISKIVFISWDSNARASFQRGEECAGDAVDHPHGHSIELRAARWPDSWRGGGGDCHDGWGGVEEGVEWISNGKCGERDMMIWALLLINIDGS